MTEPINPADGQPEPFLRITATYPEAAGLPRTVEVVLHLDDELSPPDADPLDDDVMPAWFPEFCASLVAALRCDVHDQPIIAVGAAAGSR